MENIISNKIKYEKINENKKEEHTVNENIIGCGINLKRIIKDKNNKIIKLEKISPF